MVLGPESAVGLGAGILQFVSFTAKLLTTANELRETANGATVENCDIEAVTRSLVWLTGQLSEPIAEWNAGCQSWETRSQADLNINELGHACQEIANELLEALQKLKLHDRSKKWKSIVQALKTVLAKGKVEFLQAQLEQYRQAIQTALLISLRDRVDSISPTLLEELRGGTPLDKLKSDVLQSVRTGSSRSGDSSTIAITSEMQAEFCRSLSLMNDQERRGLIQSQVLEQLSFTEQLEREHHIEDAHVKTFRWIFQDPRKTGKPWSDFVAWMEGDEDHLYWMTGKPGSGKSTMMKYVVHHLKCTRSLGKWAKDIPLVITRFYFWNSGSADQMSQESLLRSILHDAISQQRQILPLVLPHRYQRSLLFGCDIRPWSLEELQRAFKRLVAAAAANKFKLCMFVDGLDEFDGDLDELVGLFNMAMLHQNVKACVASRPWNVFEEAFMDKPGLKLEDITYPDIVAYVKSHLESNSGFNILKRREPEFASILVENISKKSSGVFLWVNLVVRSLLSGLSNYDHLSDLQRRLDQFPGDLEDFYKKIFRSIEPFYQEHAYQLFRLVASGGGQLTALGLSFADEDPDVAFQTALRLPSAPLGDSEKTDRYEQVRRRLNACCKGFLELPSKYPHEIERIKKMERIERMRQIKEMKRLEEMERIEGIRRIKEDIAKIRRIKEDIKRIEAEIADAKQRKAEIEYVKQMEAELANAKQEETELEDELKEKLDDELKEELEDELEDELKLERLEERMYALDGNARAHDDHSISNVSSRSEDHGNKGNRLSESISSQEGLSDDGTEMYESSLDPEDDELSLDSEDDDTSPPAEENRQESLPYLGKVAYLHRTVREFLDSEDVAALILQGTASFSPYLLLLCSNLQLIKAWEDSFDANESRVRLGMEVFTYAAALEPSDTRYHDVLDELDQILSFHHACILENRPKPRTFSESAALFGLHSYISKKILHGAMVFAQDDERSLLYGVIKLYGSYPSFQEPRFLDLPELGAVPSIRLVQHLLHSGSDPNSALEGRSVWEDALCECVHLADMRRSLTVNDVRKEIIPRLLHWAEIIKLFIKAGADPRVNRNSQMGTYVREAYADLLPETARQLEKQLSRVASRWSAVGKFKVPPFKKMLPTRDQLLPLRLLNHAAMSDAVPWHAHFGSATREAKSRDENKTSAEDGRRMNNPNARQGPDFNG